MPETKAQRPPLTEAEHQTVELAIARAQFHAARRHASQQRSEGIARETVLAAAVLELGARVDQAEERLRAAEAELAEMQRPLIRKLIHRLRRHGRS